MTRKRVRALFTEGYENSNSSILSDLSVYYSGGWWNLEKAVKIQIFGQTVEGSFINEKNLKDPSARIFVMYGDNVFKINGVDVQVAKGAMTLKDRKVVKGLNIRNDVILEGYSVKAGAIYFYDNGKLAVFSLSKDQVIGGLPLPAGTQVSLDEKGEIEYTEFKVVDNVVYKGRNLQRGDNVYVRNGVIMAIASESDRSHKISGVAYRTSQYDDKGNITYGRLAEWNTEAIQGFKCINHVYFHANGKLKSCVVKGASWNGLVFNGELELYDNGVVKKGLITKHKDSVSDENGYPTYYQTYQGYRLWVTEREATKVEFHSSGSLKSAIFLNEQKFGKDKCLGVVKKYTFKKKAVLGSYSPGAYTVELGKNGQVISCAKE